MLVFHGRSNFRERLAFSCVSGRSIKIKDLSAFSNSDSTEHADVSPKERNVVYINEEDEELVANYKCANIFAQRSVENEEARKPLGVATESNAACHLLLGDGGLGEGGRGAVGVGGLGEKSEEVGIRDYEACLLRLISKITDGSKIEISECGEEILFRPGMIIGTPNHVSWLYHRCCSSRSITYFLNFLILVCPFAKYESKIKLVGVTDNSVDSSVDTFRQVCLPFMRHVGISEGLELQIKNRCFPRSAATPLCGAKATDDGEVFFKCPIVKSVAPFQLVDGGKIKRVRGVAFCKNVSQQFCRKAIDSAKSILNKFTSDVWIYIQKYNQGSASSASGDNSSSSLGFGLSLVAESEANFYFGADNCFFCNRNTNLKTGGLHNYKCFFLDSKDYQMRENQHTNNIDHPNNTNSTNNTNSNTTNNKNTDNTNHAVNTNITCNPNTSADVNNNAAALSDPAYMLGLHTANRLLSELEVGLIVDTSHQHIPLFFMALADEYYLSKVLYRKLTMHAIETMREISLFFNVKFSFEENFEKNEVVVFCTGRGLINLAKSTF